MKDGCGQESKFWYIFRRTHEKMVPMPDGSGAVGRHSRGRSNTDNQSSTGRGGNEDSFYGRISARMVRQIPGGEIAEEEAEG